MTGPAERFPFVAMDPTAGAASLQPFLPLRLTLGPATVNVSGLLDTGATVNVLPFDIGASLGADWDRQTTPVRLTGNLAAAEARVLVVTATVGQFPPVRLAFAWTRLNAVPVILGQVNFFLEFDVCFYRSQAAFDVRPKS